MNLSMVEIKNRVAHIPRSRYPEVGRLVCHFLDVAATATARGSFYDSKAVLQRATDEVHAEVFGLDRGIYGVLLALPGVLDYSRQKGVGRLLAQPGNGNPTLLTLAQETRLIGHLTAGLPQQRRLKLFGEMKKDRTNNARTRRLVLKSILNDPNLTWSVIKYRRKIETALKHAWGVRVASIIRSILFKFAADWSAKENAIIRTNVLSWLEGDVSEAVLFECLSFVLGNEESWTLPKLRAYRAAKSRFRAGSELPPEVMEGIRSTYHPARSQADVLELTERQATTGQRIRVQRSAKEKGVEVAFNPQKYDLVQLYVYAYEMGLDDEIQAAIQQKARQKGAALPMQFEHVGIVLDTSRSMIGSETQKHRPMATALAIKDVLAAASKRATIRTTDPTIGPASGILPEPRAHTSLAVDTLLVAQEGPESIFVITDGYENAPAGRFAEVVAQLRAMGNQTPIYQLSPVMAAEVHGTRNLANDVPVLPVNQTINIGLGMVKLMLEQDFIRGLAALIDSANVFYLAEEVE